MAQITFQMEDGSQHPVDLANPNLTLGRHESNRIVIPLKFISSFHAELRWIPKEKSFEVKDLGSFNGTFVNNQKVRRAVLKDGDAIQFGLLKGVYHANKGPSPQSPTPSTPPALVPKEVKASPTPVQQGKLDTTPVPYKEGAVSREDFEEQLREREERVKEREDSLRIRESQLKEIKELEAKLSQTKGECADWQSKLEVLKTENDRLLALSKDEQKAISAKTKDKAKIETERKQAEAALSLLLANQQLAKSELVSLQTGLKQEESALTALREKETAALEERRQALSTEIAAMESRLAEAGSDMARVGEARGILADLETQQKTAQEALAALQEQRRQEESTLTALREKETAALEERRQALSTEIAAMESRLAAIKDDCAQVDAALLPLQDNRKSLAQETETLLLRKDTLLQEITEASRSLNEIVDQTTAQTQGLEASRRQWMEMQEKIGVSAADIGKQDALATEIARLADEKIKLEQVLEGLHREESTLLQGKESLQQELDELESMKRALGGTQTRLQDEVTRLQKTLEEKAAQALAHDKKVSTWQSMGQELTGRVLGLRENLTKLILEQEKVEDELEAARALLNFQHGEKERLINEKEQLTAQVEILVKDKEEAEKRRNQLGLLVKEATEKWQAMLADSEALGAKVALLRNEHESLEATVGALKQEESGFRERLDESRPELVRMEEEANRIAAHLAEALEEQNKLQQSVATLHAREQELLRSTDALAKEKQDAETRTATLFSQHEALSRAIEELAQEKVDAEAKLASTMEQGEAARLRHDEKCAQLEQALSTRRSEVDNAETLLITLTQKLKEMEAALLSKREENQEIEQRLRQNRAEIDRLQKDRVSAVKDEALAQKERAAIAGELVSLRARIQAGRQELENVSTEKAGVEQFLTSSRKAVAQLEETRGEAVVAKRELEILREETQRQKRDRDLLDKSLHEAREQLQSRLEESRKLAERQREVERDLATAKADLERYREESVGLLERGEEARKLVKQSRTETARLQEELHRLEEENSRVDGELEHKKAELARLEGRVREISFAEAHLKSLKSESEKYRVDLDALKISVEELQSDLSKKEKDRGTLAARLQELNEEARQSASTLAEAQKERESFQRKVEDLRILMTGLTQDHDKVKRTKEEYEAEARHRREELETLEKELEGVRHLQRALADLNNTDDIEPQAFFLFASDLIRKVDLLDAFIGHCRKRGDAQWAVEQLLHLRASFLDLLSSYGIEHYDIDPGTPLDLDLRRRIKIVETRGETKGSAKVLESLRPGFIYGTGSGRPVILRKAEVAASSMGA